MKSLFFKKNCLILGMRKRRLKTLTSSRSHKQEVAELGPDPMAGVKCVLSAAPACEDPAVGVGATPRQV